MNTDKNPLQQLLTLPTEAQNRLEFDSLINQKLSYQCEGQSILIQDLTLSIPDNENMVQKISEIDSQIEEIDRSLCEFLSILADLLQQPKTEPKIAGTILSTILLNTIKSIDEISYNAIEKSKPFVSIFDLMNIEQQLFSIIGDLSKRGLLPESNEEFQNRTKIIKAHTEKLLHFINDFSSGNNNE